MLALILVCLSLYFFMGIVGMLLFRHDYIIKLRLPFLVTALGILRVALGFLYLTNLVLFYNPKQNIIQKPNCTIDLWVRFILTTQGTTLTFFQGANFAQRYLKQRTLRLSNSGISAFVMADLKSFYSVDSKEQGTTQKSWFSSTSDWVLRKVIKILVTLECKPLITFGYFQLNYRKDTFGWIAIVMVMLIVLALTLLAIGIQYSWAMLVNHRSFESVGCNRMDYGLLDALVILLSTIAPFLIKGMATFKDDIGIRLEMTLYTFFLAFRYFFSLMYGYFLNPEGAFARSISPAIWKLVVLLGIFTLSIYYPLFLNFYRRRFRSIPIGYSLSHFDYVINHPILFQELKELASKQFCIENILFIKDMRDLKKHAGDNVLLLRLYETYIVPGSTLELNVSYQMFADITKKLHLGTLCLHHFDTVYRHILDLAMRSTFLEFVHLHHDLVIPE